MSSLFICLSFPADNIMIEITLMGGRLLVGEKAEFRE